MVVVVICVLEVPSSKVTAMTPAVAREAVTPLETNDCENRPLLALALIEYETSAIFYPSRMG